MKTERGDKRPFCDVDDGKKVDEEEEEEEEKVERFFALIRSFRDARDGVKKREVPNNEAKTSDQKKDSGKSLWVPSFQWEDFAEKIEFRKPPLILPRCNHEEDDDNKRKKQKKDKKEEEEGGGARLDLQLAL